MLKKSSRLNAAEVREVLKNGRSINGAGVSARYTKATASKAAVVVSSKVARSAVVRNRLRRMGYSALTSLPARTHIVIFIRQNKATVNDILSLCSKLS